MQRLVLGFPTIEWTDDVLLQFTKAVRREERMLATFNRTQSTEVLKYNATARLYEKLYGAEYSLFSDHTCKKADFAYCIDGIGIFTIILGSATCILSVKDPIIQPSTLELPSKEFYMQLKNLIRDNICIKHTLVHRELCEWSEERGLSYK